MSHSAKTHRPRLRERAGDYLIPPPALLAMQGKFLAFDPHEARLTARFPVSQTYLNPYHTIRGSMSAAALDNTLGSLSVLVESPNVTPGWR
jgi:acyl-coenzyme A thioesterase PaaI-like protein